MKLLILPAVLLVSLLCPEESLGGSPVSQEEVSRHLANVQTIVATEPFPVARIAALNDYANDNGLTLNELLAMLGIDISALLNRRERFGLLNGDANYLPLNDILRGLGIDITALLNRGRRKRSVPLGQGKSQRQ